MQIWQVQLSSRRDASAHLLAPPGRYSIKSSSLNKSFLALGREIKRPTLLHNRQLHVFARKRPSPYVKQLRDIFIRRRTIATSGLENRHKTALLYLSSAAVLACGLSYAAVPMCRLYCQASGYGSAKQIIDFGSKIESMERVEDRILTVRFKAGTSKTLRWRFKPQQKEVKLAPGETSLAFYTAENLTDDPIIGIATYNVIPFEAGQYFNKIQCFYFEEQQLNPGEEVDMPVFFYIDPEFMEDPKLAKYDELILSYTFFQSNDDTAPSSSPHTPAKRPADS